jgi:galactoside O-acetyltransferase
MVDEKYKNVFCADVIIGRHVIIGSGSVILPGVSLGDGVAIGALSMVSQNCDPFYIYAGVPAKKIKERSKNILKLEKEFLKQRE